MSKEKEVNLPIREVTVTRDNDEVIAHLFVESDATINAIMENGFKSSVNGVELEKEKEVKEKYKHVFLSNATRSELIDELKKRESITCIYVPNGQGANIKSVSGNVFVHSSDVSENYIFVIHENKK